MNALVRGFPLVALVVAAGAARGQVIDAYWNGAVPGDWDNPLRWSTDPIFPNNEAGARYRAIFQATGTAYTVQLRQRTITVDEVVLDSPSATLLVGIQGVLRVENRLDLRQGTFRLANGEFSGELAFNGGTFNVGDNSGNRLRDVRLVGDWNVPGAAQFRVAGSFGFDRINFNQRATVSFENSMTLSDSSIVHAPGQGALTLAVETDATLTLDSTFSLRMGEGTIGSSAFTNGNTSRLVNNGTIIADGAGRTVSFVGDQNDGAWVTNNGLIRAENGATLRLNSYFLEVGRVEAAGAGTTCMISPVSPGGGSTSASGALAASDGATLTIQNSWHGSGPITAANAGLVRLGGIFNADVLEACAGDSPGSIEVFGRADNAGTLTLDSASGVVLAGGEIRGGIVDTAPATVLALKPGTSSRLQDVSFIGDADVRNATLSLLGDWSVEGSAIAGNGGVIDVGGTFTASRVANISHTGIGQVRLAGTWQEPGGTAAFSPTSTFTSVASTGVVDVAEISVAPGHVLASSGMLRAETFTGGGQIDLQTSGMLLAGTQSGTGLISPGVTVTGGGRIGPLTPAGAITNQGTIRVENGRQLYIHPERFDNQGTIDVASGTLTIGFGTSAASPAPAWSNSGVMNVASGATVILGGRYSTAGLGQINNAGTVIAGGVLDNAGQTLVVTPGWGQWRLGSGGRVEGGTIIAAPGSALVLGGGGEVRGATLSGSFPVDGLTVSGGLSGDASLVFEPFASSVTFSGDQTFAGGSLLIPDTTQSQRRIRMAGHSSLTIGPGAQIRGGESIIGHNEESYRSSGTLRNQGSIIGDVANRTMVIGADSFVNEGLVEARAGTVRIQQPNRPSQAVWSSTGLMRVLPGATLFLGGTASSAAMGSFENAGTIVIGGVLDNSGRTMVMGPAEGLWRFSGNTSRVEGGTIVAQPGALFSLAGGGELRGVSLSGRFPVNNVTITQGLSGDGTLEFEPTASIMTFSGTQVFSGGTILIPGTTAAAGRISTTGHSSLTIGPGAEIRAGEAVIGHNENALRSNGTLRNQGRIIADVPCKTVVIGADSFANEGVVEARGGNIRIQQPVRPGQAVWSNVGTIRAVDGGRVELSGTVSTGSVGTFDTSGGSLIFSSLTIDNQDQTLHLGPATGNVSGKFVVKGGVLDVAPGYSLTAQDTSTLDGVAVNGDVYVAGNRSLNIRSGLALNGTVHLASPGSTLAFLDFDQTLSFGTVLFEGPAGADRILGGGELSSFTIGPGATVRGGRGAVLTLNHATTIENRGLISADVAGQAIRVHTTRFSNSGTIEAVNGGIIEYINPPGLEGDGVLINSGVLMIGAGSTLHAVGDFVNNPEGVVRLFLHWSDSRPLDVDGMATLGGGLDVLAGERAPRFGDRFSLISAAGFEGGFSRVTLPELGAGLSWDTSSLSTSGDIRVVPAPAPGLVLLGAMTVGRRRRGEARRNAR